jgi:hypothetical protein
MAHPSLSGEEVERRGQALYEQSIRAKVAADNKGKICMIDVETGDYDIGDTMLETSGRMLARRPGAALWAVRIGHDVVYSFGGATEPAKR